MMAEAVDWSFFWKWVENSIADYERRTGEVMSYRKMEAVSGLSNAAVSYRAREKLKPTEAVFEALRVALDIPVRESMEVAGLIEFEAELRSSPLRETLAIMKRLSPVERERVLRYIIFQHPKEAAAAGVDADRASAGDSENETGDASKSDESSM